MNNKAVLQLRLDRSTPIRVLLADPDESLQPVYREPLSQKGFDVVPAFSGLECIAHLREWTPDVLVLDPQLPWGGGDGVLAMMGEVPKLAKVPVLVLTSCRDPLVMNRVARFPVSGYSFKPLAPDQLAQKLRTLLDVPRLRFPLTSQTGRLERSIATRTAGRIQDLHVETEDGRVIVRGRSDSQDVKRLALEAILEAFEASESQTDRIELLIEVR